MLLVHTAWLALLAPASAQELPAGLPAGADVPVALFFDLTDDAITPEKTKGILQQYVPPAIQIDQLVPPGTLEGGGTAVDAGPLFGIDYQFFVENLEANPTLNAASVVPTSGEVCRAGPNANDPTDDFYENGYLNVLFDAAVGINSAPTSPPARAVVKINTKLLFFINFTSTVTCAIKLAPQPITAGVKVRIGLPDAKAGSVIAVPRTPPQDIFEPIDAGYCPYQTIAAYRSDWGNTCQPIDVNIDQFEWTFDAPNITDLIGSTVDCGGFVNFLATVATQFGLVDDDVLTQLLAEQINPTIDAALADAQVALDEGLASALPEANGYALLQQVDLLGKSLEVELCPTDVGVDDNGLRALFSGHAQSLADPDACIARYDLGGSRKFNPRGIPNYPQLDDRARWGEKSYGVKLASPPEVVAGIDDDFINQVLYEAWRSGLLCQTLDAETLAAFDLPIDLPFDETLLSTFSDGGYDDLLLKDAGYRPEGAPPRPFTLALVPRKTPVAATTPGRLSADGKPIAAAIGIEQLGLDLYFPVDERQVRLVGFELNTSAGLSAPFNTRDGSLAVSVDFDASTLKPEVVFGDLYPVAGTTFANRLSGLLQTVLGGLLDSLLGGLSVELPSVSGLGVQTLNLTPLGAPNQPDPPVLDYVGILASVGEVEYGEPAGCDLLSGDLSGVDCGGGCASAPVSTRLAWLLLPLLVAGIRRRR